MSFNNIEKNICSIFHDISDFCQIILSKKNCFFKLVKIFHAYAKFQFIQNTLNYNARWALWHIWFLSERKLISKNLRGGIPGLLVQTESSLIMNGLNPPPHQQVTENFMVPDQLVGLIIGKNGEVSVSKVNYNIIYKKQMC